MGEPQDVNIETKLMEENYLDFLDDNEDQATYTNLVKAMIEENKIRLIVQIDDVRKKYPERAYGLLHNSFTELIHFQIALKKFVETIEPEYAQKHHEFFIGFNGNFGSKHVTPRTLTSRFLGNLVCLEGIVIRCSSNRIKLVKTVHYCPATNKFTERTHSDYTSYDAVPSSGHYLQKDDNGNPLETEYGLSEYKDHQTVTIQELPEKAPAGQMPRSIEVIIDNDLTDDSCKPGDRVQIVGCFRCLPGKHGGYTSGTFRTIVIANNVILKSKEVSADVSPSDVQMCKKLAKNNPRKNIVELLSKSLAPSIYGHEYVKKAILLLLLGGTEKVLLNGTRLRGDINILLIGDPSVAKSQLLRYVLCTAPRAIPTTGRGSSGVGLTAAVSSDQETGERILEAGAMVLADRGVICIDEFDKMTDIDRTAIHEVMEQGRVTIAKAGIHATLNARCSVLAAANPVYGRYDPYKSPMENIGLQDSLLSRFDLLFVLLDKSDADIDHMISDHVVRMHRYRDPSEKDGAPMPLNIGVDVLSTRNPDDIEIDNTNVDIYEKYDPLLHGNMRSKNDKILTADFMRKYIHLAKLMKPELTNEAAKAISDEYSDLRSQDKDPKIARTQPVTARTLETLIRLATAHAKARLSKKVTIDDANAAIELVQYAYFKRVLEKEKRNKRSTRDSEDDDDADDPSEKPTKRTRRTPRSQGGESTDVYDYDDEDPNLTVESISKSRSATARGNGSVREPSTAEEQTEQMDVDTLTVTVTNERLELFQKYLNELFTSTRADSLTIQRIQEFVRKKSSDFSNEEMKAILTKMSDQNKIMIANDEVIPI